MPDMQPTNRFRAAFLKYGRHDADCAYQVSNWHDFPDACNCGFYEVAKEMDVEKKYTAEYSEMVDLLRKMEPAPGGNRILKAGDYYKALERASNLAQQNLPEPKEEESHTPMDVTLAQLAAIKLGIGYGDNPSKELSHGQFMALVRSILRGVDGSHGPA